MRKYVSLLALVILVAFSTFPSYASEFIANDGTKVEVKVIDREDIPNGGKDIYVYTNGTLDYYLLVDGLVKLYSRPVNLSGTVAVIH